MASIQLHKDQIARNYELLGQDFFDTKTSTSKDWIVTISFYTSLHFIDMALEYLGYGEPGSHSARNGFIRYGDKFTDIANDYGILYSQSRRARYKCIRISQGDADQAKRILTDIKQHCEKLLKSAP